MLTYTNPLTKRPVALIGIDPGNGYIKTVNTCFRAGVAPYKDATYNSSSLQYGGVHYTIGNAHKDYMADKTADQDYYILMLAAIARELELANLHSADVRLAVGLPLASMSEQKDRFHRYLTREEEIRFTYNNADY